MDNETTRTDTENERFLVKGAVQGLGTALSVRIHHRQAFEIRDIQDEALFQGLRCRLSHCTEDRIVHRAQGARRISENEQVSYLSCALDR